MKLVIGIVRPEKANDVLEALYRAEVSGVSLSRVQGHGGELDRVIEAIEKSANTGKIGDGKIFVFELEQVVRIRTGETGADAL